MEPSAYPEKIKKQKLNKKYIENPNKIKFIRELNSKIEKIKYTRKAFKDCKIVIVQHQDPIRK